jgi:hypothetical protein
MLFWAKVCHIQMTDSTLEKLWVPAQTWQPLKLFFLKINGRTSIGKKATRGEWSDHTRCGRLIWIVVDPWTRGGCWQNAPLGQANLREGHASLGTGKSMLTPHNKAQTRSECWCLCEKEKCEIRTRIPACIISKLLCRQVVHELFMRHVSARALSPHSPDRPELLALTT